jgi:hypothetical protein
MFRGKRVLLPRAPLALACGNSCSERERSAADAAFSAQAQMTAPASVVLGRAHCSLDTLVKGRGSAPSEKSGRGSLAAASGVLAKYEDELLLPTRNLHRLSSTQSVVHGESAAAENTTPHVPSDDRVAASTLDRRDGA